MLEIDPNGTLKETNELRIKTVKPPTDHIEALLDEYKEVFQGIGCFRDKHTGEKIEVKLEMDPEAIPVAQQPRPVPYHLQKPLKELLEQGVKEQDKDKDSQGYRRCQMVNLSHGAHPWSYNQSPSTPM